MKYDAVVFDLDGTLLDTIEDLTDSMNQSLAELNCPPCSIADCKFYVGNGVREFARQALPETRRDEKTLSRCVEIMRNHYARNWANKTAPYEGIGEMLSGLLRAGLKLTVLSNKPDDFTQLMVSHFFADVPFEIVLGARKGIPHKPDPAGAIEIAERLGLPPRRCLYLGDTNTDMNTANGAGMYAVGALWGFRPAEELRESGAKVLIEHPTDLLKLI